MTPFFSIILPVYNVAPYLRRCARSITEQSFQNYELILVDDGSTDNSGRICDELSQEHSNICVIHKLNGGLSSARNAGFEMAQGRYVWWVDSDDWIEEDALKILYQAVSEDQPDIVKFNYYRVTDVKTPILSKVSEGCYRGPERDTLLEKALISTGAFALSVWSCVYSREFLCRNKLQYVSERIVCSEDYLFNLEALLLAGNVRLLAKPLYNYELREGSLSQRYISNLPGKYLELYSRLQNVFCREGFGERWKAEICCFYAWHLIHGVVLPNAYTGDKKSGLLWKRKEVRKILRAPEVRAAVENCAKAHFSWKQRIQLWAMKWGIEPVFYWLYVIKPRIGKVEA